MTISQFLASSKGKAVFDYNGLNYWGVSTSSFLKLSALAWLFRLKSVGALPSEADCVQWWASMKTLVFISEKTTLKKALKHLTFAYILNHFHCSLEVSCICLNKKESLHVLIFSHFFKNSSFSYIWHFKQIMNTSKTGYDSRKTGLKLRSLKKFD